MNETPIQPPPFAVNVEQFDKQPDHPLLLLTSKHSYLLHPLQRDEIPVSYRNELSIYFHIGSIAGDQVHKESGLTQFTLTDNDTGEQIHIFDPERYLSFKVQLEYEYYLSPRTGLSFLLGYTTASQKFDLIERSLSGQIISYSFIGAGVRLHTSPAGQSGASLLFYGGFAGGEIRRQPCYHDFSDLEVPETGIAGWMAGIQPQFELYYKSFKTSLGLNITGAFFHSNNPFYGNPLKQPFKVFSWDLFIGFGAIL